MCGCLSLHTQVAAQLSLAETRIAELEEALATTQEEVRVLFVVAFLCCE